VTLAAVQFGACVRRRELAVLLLFSLFDSNKTTASCLRQQAPNCTAASVNSLTRQLTQWSSAQLSGAMRYAPGSGCGMVRRWQLLQPSSAGNFRTSG